MKSSPLDCQGSPHQPDLSTLLSRVHSFPPLTAHGGDRSCSHDIHILGSRKEGEQMREREPFLAGRFHLSSGSGNDTELFHLDLIVQNFFMWQPGAAREPYN